MIPIGFAWIHLADTRFNGRGIFLFTLDVEKSEQTRRNLDSPFRIRSMLGILERELGEWDY